jgi:hypothetical protein
MLRCAAIVIVTACRFHFADVSTDGPAARDATMACPANAILCDDFESGTTAKWSSTRTVDGPLDVDGAHVHTGSFALHSLVSPATGNGSETYVAHALASPPVVLATRVWVYLPNPIEGFQGVIYLVDLPAESHYLGATTEIPNWSASGNSTAGLFDYSGSIAVQQATWTCVELDVDRDAKTLQLFVGDELAETAAIMDPSPVFGTVAVGATRANADGYENYVDDVVIAPAHIGCI